VRRGSSFYEKVAIRRWKIVEIFNDRKDYLTKNRFSQRLILSSGLGLLSSLNIFDAVICIAMLIAAISGYNAGLVRSLAVMTGYLCATPLAVTVTTHFSSSIQPTAPWGQNFILFFIVFIALGSLIGALFRFSINDLFGASINPVDRIAGSCLGMIRICFVAIAAVIVFDRIIPSDREPGFLHGSTLHPLLSRAAQRGFRSLPPDMISYIDQLKKDRGI
jgi:membrane protein required for colicin V production